jgi:hypothetical protein
MATTNIKRVVANAIATYIGENVTGLSGKVSAVQEGPEKTSEFPSVALLPSVFAFTPSEPDEVYENEDEDDGKVLLDVGEFDGAMELQLYTKSKPERELYEQRILDLFLSQEGSPGTLFVETPELTVGGYVSLHTVEIKVRLDSEEWNEEFSFDAKRYSFLDLEVAFPALVARDAVTIEDLQIALQRMGAADDDYETLSATEEAVAQSTRERSFSWTALVTSVTQTITIPDTGMRDNTYVVAGFVLRDPAPGDGAHPDIRFPTAGRTTTTFTAETDTPIREGSVYDVMLRDRS